MEIALGKEVKCGTRTGRLWEPRKSPAGEWVNSFCVLTVNADGRDRDVPGRDAKRPRTTLATNSVRPWLYVNYFTFAGKVVCIYL